MENKRIPDSAIKATTEVGYLHVFYMFFSIFILFINVTKQSFFKSFFLFLAL